MEAKTEADPTTAPADGVSERDGAGGQGFNRHLLEGLDLSNTRRGPLELEELESCVDDDAGGDGIFIRDKHLQAAVVKENREASSSLTRVRVGSSRDACSLYQPTPFHTCYVRVLPLHMHHTRTHACMHACCTHARTYAYCTHAVSEAKARPRSHHLPGNLASASSQRGGAGQGRRQAGETTDPRVGGETGPGETRPGACHVRRRGWERASARKQAGF